MKIVTYQESYRNDVEKICLNGKEDELSKAMVRIFADSYLDIDSSYSFFLVDEGKNVKGYLLSYPDYKIWKNKLTSYLESAGALEKAIMAGSLEAMKPYAKDYPAHFHIDLDASVRHQGYGTLLLRCLEEKLLSSSVSGYMLNVAVDNEKAISFYQKNGFVEIGRNEMEIAFGKKLGKKKRKK